MNVGPFLFHKLSHETFLNLEILINVDYYSAFYFMHGLNKASRNFLETSTSTIQNVFINYGLIDYYFWCDFIHI